MKIYVCDICKRKFGGEVGFYLAPRYIPSEFPDAFYQAAPSTTDICAECMDRIAKAQQTEIEKIQSKKGVTGNG